LKFFPSRAQYPERRGLSVHSSAASAMFDPMHSIRPHTTSTRYKQQRESGEGCGSGSREKEKRKKKREGKGREGKAKGKGNECLKHAACRVASGMLRVAARAALLVPLTILK